MITLFTHTHTHTHTNVCRILFFVEYYQNISIMLHSEFSFDLWIIYIKHNLCLFQSLPPKPRVQLYVEQKEEQKEEQEQKEVLEGSSVSLRCSAETLCSSPPPTLTWRSTPRIPLSESSRLQELISDLNFTATHREHGVTFTCTITYQLQDKNKTAQDNITLHVQCKWCFVMLFSFDLWIILFNFYCEDLNIFSLQICLKTHQCLWFPPALCWRAVQWLWPAAVMQIQQCWTTPGSERVKDSWSSYRLETLLPSIGPTWHTEAGTTVQLRTNMAGTTHQ